MCKPRWRTSAIPPSPSGPGHADRHWPFTAGSIVSRMACSKTWTARWRGWRKFPRPTGFRAEFPVAITDLEQRLSRLEAIEAIKQLKARYFHACDTKQVAG